jgi:hypothetical protein
VVLQDRDGYLVTIIPASHKLDLQAVDQELLDKAPSARTSRRLSEVGRARVGGTGQESLTFRASFPR